MGGITDLQLHWLRRAEPAAGAPVGEWMDVNGGRVKAEAPGTALPLRPSCLTSSAGSFLMLLTPTATL